MRWRTSGDGWRLANSLITLGNQLSDLWPQSGPADGTIGDAAHRARKSDHNPNLAGIVTAIDVDEVVEDRGQALVDALVGSRDARIKYVIHESKIWRSYPKPGIPTWTPAPYTGLTNMHLSHVHLSVVTASSLFDSRRLWDLDTIETGENPMASISVKEWQAILNVAGVTDHNGNPLVEDDDYGPKTRAALVKLASSTSLDVGAHNHNSLYSAKDHPHTII